MYGNESGDFRSQRSPPVQIGDEIDVKIEAVGEKGDGIAKKDGFVLFVPGVKEGDVVRIRVTKVLQKVGFAEVVGEAQGEPESDQPAEEAPVEAPEEAAEDSEDFGEEPAEEPAAEEEPAEEPAEEEPAEEKPEE